MTATTQAREARTRPTTIEAGGIEPIPTEHRHGSPWQLLSTWSAPTFATRVGGSLSDNEIVARVDAAEVAA